MSLPWIRLDTTIFDHPKFADLIVEKRYRLVVLHLQAMTYSGKHGLGGHIPKNAATLMGVKPAEAADLVCRGLWDPDLDGNGWHIHGWDERQPTSETWERRRRVARENAQKRWEK